MAYVDVPMVETRPVASPVTYGRGLDEVTLRLDDFHEDLALITKTSAKFAHQTYLRNEYVGTPYGPIYVEVIGDRKKTPILTYHDIGMNHRSSFSNFFYSSDMMPLADHFCVYHLNAPGQEEGAPRLPEDYVYPTVDELADQVQSVVDHFKLRRFIGMGSGAGANVLTRFALSHPGNVQGLILVNPTAGVAGWTEWGYQKLNARFLRKQGIGQFSFDYLLWHYFGRKSLTRQTDLIDEVRENLGNMEAFNLANFIDSYTKRPKLGLTGRTTSFFGSAQNTLSCSTMLLVGDDSPHLDDVTLMNSGLDPTRTTLFKVADCGGLALEEQPEKAAESIRLFLQGMGYIPLLKSTRLAPQNITMARCQSAYTLLAKDWGIQRAQSTLSLRGY